MADTVQTVIDEVQYLLNDQAGTRWDFNSLLPALQKAHREMQLKVSLAGLPVLKKTSAVITVPALTTDLTAPAGGGASLQPSDLIEPSACEERQSGTSDLFSPMEEAVWEPDVEQTEWLRFWMWREEKVQFVGATVDVDIKLHYTKGLTIPTSENDSLGLINAILYLSPRTAAIASGRLGGIGFQLADANARELIDELVRFNIKTGQGVPVRRIGYRRGRMRNRILY